MQTYPNPCLVLEHVQFYLKDLRTDPLVILFGQSDAVMKSD